MEEQQMYAEYADDYSDFSDTDSGFFGTDNDLEEMEVEDDG